MANSFDTVAVDVIAQEALTRLIQKLSFVKSIHKDFSTTALAKNQSVITHIISEMSASDVDFASGGGYVSSTGTDLIQSDVEIALNKHKAVTFTLSDDERDKSSIDLFNRFAEVASYGLAKGNCRHFNRFRHAWCGGCKYYKYCNRRGFKYGYFS